RRRARPQPHAGHLAQPVGRRRRARRARQRLHPRQAHRRRHHPPALTDPRTEVHDMTVLVIGEALVDVVNGATHVGGSPLNVAVGLSRLDRATRLLTRFGDDEWGRLIAAQLEANGVEQAQAPDAQRTSSAKVTLDAAGVPSYDFDIHWALDEAVVAGALDAPTRVVHTGSIATVLQDRKSTRLNSSHVKISYAVFCLKKKNTKTKDEVGQRSSTQ